MFKKRLSKILATALMPLLLVSNVNAENPKWNFYFNGNAKHFSEREPFTKNNPRFETPKKKEYNEKNNIMGISYNVNDSLEVGIRQGINSYNDPIKIMGVEYKKCVGNQFKVCPEISAGVVHGYKKRREVTTVPLATIGVEFGYGAYGLESKCLPGVNGYCLFSGKIKF